MKGIIAVISFICYFAATSGIVINSHYCMKRMVSKQLPETKSKASGKCCMKMQKSNKCCHNEIKVVKLQQDQQQFSENVSLKALETPVSYTSLYLVLPFQNLKSTHYFQNHSPPLLSASDIYLQINVFRI